MFLVFKGKQYHKFCHSPGFFHYNCGIAVWNTFRTEYTFDIQFGAQISCFTSISLQIPEGETTRVFWL